MVAPPDLSTPYVFFSYTTPDRDRVLALADRLETAGLRVWVDRRSLVGGVSWDAAIVRAIKACTVFAVLCTPSAVASPNVLQELRLAWAEQRPTLPVLLAAVTFPDEMRYVLTGRQWVEAGDRPEDAWFADLCRALAGLGLTPNIPEATPAGLPAGAANPLPEPAAIHLPTPLTSFIGREEELAEVIALLGTTRLLTLTGPGGTGKTRLALAAARQLADRFADGAWFVDLSGVADPAGVIPAIAQVLAVRESEGRSLASSLAAYLRRKRLLLVLDNFEQVIAAAMLLYHLLAEAPGLVLMVTSRVLLHVESEREYAVPPLPLPDPGAAVVPEQLGTNPAVQLFVERAQAHRAGFRLSSENAAAVAAICRRLDGLPLAIELAAARVKLLPPVQLLARLEQRLAFLTGGERNRPNRQQTLRNTIQWSWDLLASAEQLLFRRLAVFAGGFALAAAEAVCNAGGELDVLEGLAALVNQSLVRQSEHNGEPRFSLLATLQEFALERLEAAREADLLRRAHAEHYCTLAEATTVLYERSGRFLRDMLQPLDLERDNLIAALGWALAEQDAALGLRLGAALGGWFYGRAPGEGLQWVARLLGVPGAEVPSAERGRTLFGAASCAIARGEPATVIAYLEEAAACLRVAEHLPRLSSALALLAANLPAAESERALELAEEALRLAPATGYPLTLAYVKSLAGLGLLWHGGNPARVRAYWEAVRLACPRDADLVPTLTLSYLGFLAAAEGQYEEARARLREGLALAEVMGERSHIAADSVWLAQVTATIGDQDEASAHWRKGLLLAQELGSAPATAACLAGIAALVSSRQRSESAVRLLAASAQLRQAAEQDAFFGPPFQRAFQHAQATTAAAVSADAFAEAWAAGQTLSLDEATDLALAELALFPPVAQPTNAAAS